MFCVGHPACRQGARPARRLGSGGLAETVKLPGAVLICCRLLQRQAFYRSAGQTPPAQTPQPRQPTPRNQPQTTKLIHNRLTNTSAISLIGFRRGTATECPTQNMNIASTRPIYESVAGIFKRTVARQPKYSRELSECGKRAPTCGLNKACGCALQRPWLARALGRKPKLTRVLLSIELLRMWPDCSAVLLGVRLVE